MNSVYMYKAAGPLAEPFFAEQQQLPLWDDGGSSPLIAGPQQQRQDDFNRLATGICPIPARDWRDSAAPSCGPYARPGTAHRPTKPRGAAGFQQISEEDEEHAQRESTEELDARSFSTGPEDTHDVLDPRHDGDSTSRMSDDEYSLDAAVETVTRTSTSSSSSSCSNDLLCSNLVAGHHPPLTDGAVFRSNDKPLPIDGHFHVERVHPSPAASNRVDSAAGLRTPATTGARRSGRSALVGLRGLAAAGMSLLRSSGGGTISNSSGNTSGCEARSSKPQRSKPGLTAAGPASLHSATERRLARVVLSAPTESHLSPTSVPVPLRCAPDSTFLDSPFSVPSASSPSQTSLERASARMCGPAVAAFEVRASPLCGRAVSPLSTENHLISGGGGFEPQSMRLASDAHFHPSAASTRCSSLRLPGALQWLDGVRAGGLYGSDDGEEDEEDTLEDVVAQASAALRDVSLQGGSGSCGGGGGYGDDGSRYAICNADVREKVDLDAECVNWTEVEELCASMDRTGMQLEGINIIQCSPPQPSALPPPPQPLSLLLPEAALSLSVGAPLSSPPPMEGGRLSDIRNMMPIASGPPLLCSAAPPRPVSATPASAVAAALPAADSLATAAAAIGAFGALQGGQQQEVNLAVRREQVFLALKFRSMSLWHLPGDSSLKRLSSISCHSLV